jgi:hypothetical protein
MAAPKIEFGKKYRDRITGFVGTCTGKAQYISGCDQILIVADDKGDGKFPGSTWIDDERLIDVESEQAVERTSRRGGPQDSPARTT